MTTMNISCRIDGEKNYDMYLDADGNISLSYDQKAIEECCELSAATIKGEMIYNTEGGLPLFDIVFGPSPNLFLYKSLLLNTFKNVAGGDQVVSVDYLNLYVEGTTLHYEAKISTIYGNSGVSSTIQN